jgi:hypothetical protein
MVKVGDIIRVYQMEQLAMVEKVWYDKLTARTVIQLNWGEFGRSVVYAHDENKIWYIYSSAN